MTYFSHILLTYLNLFIRSRTIPVQSCTAKQQFKLRSCHLHVTQKGNRCFQKSVFVIQITREYLHTCINVRFIRTPCQFKKQGGGIVKANVERKRSNGVANALEGWMFYDTINVFLPAYELHSRASCFQ